MGHPDRPIRPHKLVELERLVQPLLRAIDQVTPDGTGFAVLLFTFDGAEATYGSNARRPDMIKALRECADRIEARQDFKATDPNDN